MHRKVVVSSSCAAPLPSAPFCFAQGDLVFGRFHLPRAMGIKLSGPFGHCPNNVLVSGAAAQVSFEAVTDVVFFDIRVRLDQLDGGHDHPRRAEPALEAMLLGESLLHDMQFSVGQALDGIDRRTVGLDGQYRAGFDRGPIHMHRTSSALGGVATHVGASESDILSDEVDQHRPGLNIPLVARPVDCD